MAKPIESLQRGLQVLQALTEGPTWHLLQELHARTEIPKPTLLAILETLQGEGLAIKGDQGWALTNTWLMSINAYTLHRLHLAQLIRQPHKEKIDERHQSPDAKAETPESGADCRAARGDRASHDQEGG